MTTTLERLARAQQRQRRRQRLLQHLAAGLLGVALLVGVSRLVPPAPTDVGTRADVAASTTYHGPFLPPGFERFARRATALVTVRTRATPTRIRRAERFDPADFAEATGTPLEEGMASYYGADFAGKPTANGEAFDPDGLTAAHRTLPLGSIIRVTNLRNNRQIVVRVNDRGPYVGDRVLDLSRGAAEALNMRGRGTARVRIDVL